MSEENCILDIWQKYLNTKYFIKIPATVYFEFKHLNNYLFFTRYSRDFTACWIAQEMHVSTCDRDIYKKNITDVFTLKSSSACKQALIKNNS